MKHTRVTATSVAAVLNSLAGLSPLAGVVVCLTAALPARGVEVPFSSSRVISTAGGGAQSVFATDLDGDIGLLDLR